jgi:hypothetical protein
MSWSVSIQKWTVFDINWTLIVEIGNNNKDLDEAVERDMEIYKESEYRQVERFKIKK